MKKKIFFMVLCMSLFITACSKENNPTESFEVSEDSITPESSLEDAYSVTSTPEKSIEETITNSENEKTSVPNSNNVSKETVAAKKDVKSQTDSDFVSSKSDSNSIKNDNGETKSSEMNDSTDKINSNTQTKAPEAAAPSQNPKPDNKTDSDGQDADADHKHHIVYKWILTEEVGQCREHSSLVDICSECGYIEKIHMDYGENNTCVLGEMQWLQKPSCSQSGEYAQTCQKCGRQTEITYVNQFEHQWDGSVQDYIVEPTCISGGRKKVKYTCTGCGEIRYEEEDCPPSENFHGDFVPKDIISEPTCTEMGRANYYCSLCGILGGESGYGDILWHTRPNTEGKCDRCGIVIE